MASLLSAVRTRFFDKSNKPLAGGKVYTYEANSTNPKVTWSDEALTVQNTNPVLLDNEGTALIFFSGKYRFRIEDKYGALVEDNPSVTSLVGIDGVTSDIVSTTIVDSPNQDDFNKKAVTTVESIADLNNLEKWEGRTVSVGGSQGGTFVYNSSNADLDDQVINFNGWTRQLDDLIITPEMAGAGIINDNDAIQKCINYLLTSAEFSKKYSIIGNGKYTFSNSVLIVNFGYGLNMYLRSVEAGINYPDKTNYKTATPFFQIGQNGVGGSMVGLNITCGYVNGGGKATWLNFGGYACGGSNFHCDKMENMVNGVSAIKPNFNAASNKITGGYWVNGTGYGAIVEKGSYVVEGWIFDVNFIANFNAGGIVLRDAQYARIESQLDFNGAYCTEITINETSFTGLTRDAVLSSGSNTADIIAFYQQKKGVYTILVYENQNTAGGSKFSIGNTITTVAGFSGTIKSLRTAASSNWYPDIVHDFSGQPFAKCVIKAPYSGGLVGSQLFSSDIQYYNSTDAKTNNRNGSQFVHSGSILTLRDAYFDTNVFDATEILLAPFRHLYMNDYRTYGQEVGVTLSKGAVTNVFQLLRKNNGTVTAVSEMYKVTCVSTDNGLNGEWDVFVNVAGNLYIRPIFENNVTASASGSNFQLAQGALVSILCVVNFQRVF